MAQQSEVPDARASDPLSAVTLPAYAADCSSSRLHGPDRHTVSGRLIPSDGLRSADGHVVLEDCFPASSSPNWSTGLDPMQTFEGAYSTAQCGHLATTEESSRRSAFDGNTSPSQSASSSFGSGSLRPKTISAVLRTSSNSEALSEKVTSTCSFVLLSMSNAMRVGLSSANRSRK